MSTSVGGRDCYAIFNPGSTLSAMDFVGIGRVATNTTLAACAAGLSSILYGYFRMKKWDASYTTNGFLAGLVAITAPSGFVNTVGAAIIGLVAGVLVCVSCAFVENVLKVDDPVGAISVHGTNGLWGVLSVGLFADGTSNYGGGWNGVTGSVTGLFYGDAGQFAQDADADDDLVGRAAVGGGDVDSRRGHHVVISAAIRSASSAGSRSSVGTVMTASRW